MARGFEATTFTLEFSGAGLSKAQFPLVERGGELQYLITRAPGLSESSRVDAAQYLDYPPGQDDVFTWQEFRAGLGRYEADPLRPETLNGYHFTKGVDPRWGDIMLAPAMTISGIQPDPQNLGMNGSYKAYAVWRSVSYAAGGRAIYKWVLIAGVWQWSLFWDPGSGTIRHMIVFNNNLIVQREADTYFSIFTNPADNTAVTQNSVFSAAVYRFATLRDTLYCAVGGNDKVYGNTLETETLLANWSDWTVGDTSFDTNEMWAANDVIWIGKDDGLYAIDGYSTGGEARCVVSLRHMPSDSNFRHWAIWGDNIVASWGYQGVNLILVNMETGLVQPNVFHPRFVGPLTPQVGGEIWGLASMMDKLYMAVRNRANPAIGFLYFLIEVSRVGDTLVYHTITGNNYAPTKIVIDHMSGMSLPVLWWFTAITPYQPRYMLLSVGGRPDEDSNYRFDTSNDLYLVTSWQAGNLVDQVKTYYYFEDFLRQVPANTWVKIHYQLDNALDSDSWTLLATFTTAGWQGEQMFPASVKGKRIRFKIELKSSSNTVTPTFSKHIVHGRLQPRSLQTVQATLLCARNLRNTATSQRTAFYSYANQDYPFNMRLPSGDTIAGTIRRETIRESAYLDGTDLNYLLSFVFLESVATVAAGV